MGPEGWARLIFGEAKQIQAEMLERIRENTPISAPICQAGAGHGTTRKQSKGDLTQSKMTNQEAGKRGGFRSEPGTPGGVSRVFGRLGLLSMKVWGPEGPGTWAEDSGFGDLSRGHLFLSLSRGSEAGAPWAGSGPVRPLWAGFSSARHVSTG